MFGKISEDETGIDLPRKWCLALRTSLNEIFEEQIRPEKKEFEVFGKVFSKEIVLAVTLLNREREDLLPITSLISKEQNESGADKKILDDMANISTLLFEELLDTNTAELEEPLYSPNWLETEYEKKQFHYKVTRENVLLTLAADELLKI